MTLVEIISCLKIIYLLFFKKYFNSRQKKINIYIDIFYKITIQIQWNFDLCVNLLKKKKKITSLFPAENDLYLSSILLLLAIFLKYNVWIWLYEYIIYVSSRKFEFVFNILFLNPS